MIGRPTELTEGLLAKLAGLASTFKTRAATATAAEVSRRTLQRWLARGRLEQLPGLYARLVEAMQKGERARERREFKEWEASPEGRRILELERKRLLARERAITGFRFPKRIRIRL